MQQTSQHDFFNDRLLRSVILTNCRGIVGEGIVTLQIEIDDNSPLAQFIAEEATRVGLTPQDVAHAILTSGVTAFKRSTRFHELSTAANWQQAYQWYLEDRSAPNEQEQTSEETNINIREFYTLLHTYHQGYMKDLSFGELAEAVGVNCATMDHIVMALGLWLNP